MQYYPQCIEKLYGLMSDISLNKLLKYKVVTKVNYISLGKLDQEIM